MFADKNSAAPRARSAEDNLLGAHSRIGEQLRAFYTEIQEEEIPRNLLILLEKLEKAENSGAAAHSAAADSAQTERREAAGAAEFMPAQSESARRSKGGRHG